MASVKKILIAKPPQQSGSSDPRPAPSHPSRPGRSGHPPRQGQRRGDGPRTKFVIRRLPPLYTEAEFRELTAECISPETTEWSYFVPGKIHKSKSKPVTYSRAYAKFRDIESLIAFKKAFTGRAVKDAKNNESTMQIEFAPYDRIPRAAKRDARQGTIDDDPEFKAFVESLNTPPPPAPAPPTPGESVSAQDPKDVSVNGNLTTPLIEFLRAKKMGARSASAAKKDGKKDKKDGKKDGINEEEKDSRRKKDRKRQGPSAARKDKAPGPPASQTDSGGATAKDNELGANAAGDSTSTSAVRREKDAGAPASASPPTTGGAGSEPKRQRNRGGRAKREGRVNGEPQSRPPAPNHNAAETKPAARLPPGGRLPQAQLPRNQLPNGKTQENGRQAQPVRGQGRGDTATAPDISAGGDVRGRRRGRGGSAAGASPGSTAPA